KQDQWGSGSDGVGEGDPELLMPGAVVHIVVSPVAADGAVGPNPEHFLLTGVTGKHDQRGIASHGVGEGDLELLIPGAVIHTVVSPVAADVAVGPNPELLTRPANTRKQDQWGSGSDGVGEGDPELLMPGAVIHIVVSPVAADVAVGPNP